MADKKIHVFSTLSCNQRYVTYAEGPNDLPIEEHSVLIKGGTGVATKHLITPLGVCTTVTDEDYEHLCKNSLFQLHEKNGFIKVQKQGKAQDVEKAAADMQRADLSAPITPSDYQKGGRFGDQPEPKTGTI